MIRLTQDNDTKTCSNTSCQQTNPQPISNFYWADKKRGYRKTLCRECYKQKSKKSFAKYYARPETKDKLRRYRNQPGIKRYHQKYSHRYQAEYMARRRKEDSFFRLKHNVRSLLKVTFNRHRIAKSLKTIEILGCSYEQLLIYLETHSPWFKNSPYYSPADTPHIDHVIPLSTAKNQEELLRLCNYTNLQWLTSRDNRDKSNTLSWVPEWAHTNKQ